MLQATHARLRLAPVSGHSMTRVMEAIEKNGLLNGGGGDFESKVIALDRNNSFSGMYYGGIAIATRCKDDVAYFVFLMTSTNGAPLQSQTVPGAGNAQLEVLMMPEKVIDQAMHNAAQSVVANAYRDTPTLMSTGAAVVQNTFNSDDGDALGQLVNIAISANLMELHRVNKVEHSFKLSDVTGSKYKIQLGVEPCDGFTLLDGTPLHATQKITMTAAPIQQSTNQDRLSINTPDQVFQLGEVYTYVELVERAPTLVPGPNGVMIPSTQRLQPRIHISHVKQIDQFGLTIAPLAIWAAMQLIPNKLWAVPLCPQKSQHGDVNIRDIGVTNMITEYVPGGGIINTDDPNFTIAEMAKLLDATVTQDPYIVIDLAGSAAEQAWLRPLILASQGDQGAIDQLWTAAELLTGKMSAVTNGTKLNLTVQQGTTTGANEVEYGGYYPDKSDKSGRLKSLANLDMLAVGVLSNGDPAVVRAWQETTMANGALHPLDRAIRRHHLRTQFTHSAVANHYVRTVTVSAQAAAALTAAVAASGVVVGMHTPPNPFMQQVQQYLFGGGVMANHAIGAASVQTFYAQSNQAAAFNNLVV